MRTTAPNGTPRAAASAIAFLSALGAAAASHAFAAPDEAEDAERASYAAHVAAADGALRLGEAGSVRRWLDGAPAAQRGFEWQLLDARSDQSAAAVDLGVGGLLGLAATRDGRLLAATSNDAKTVLVDAATFTAVRVLEGHRGTVYRADFDAAGHRLLTAGQDGTVRVWDVRDGTELRVFPDHGRAVGAARFLADGRVASCSWDLVPETRIAGILHVWDPRTGEVAWTSRGGVKPLAQLAVLPDGEHVAAASWDFCAFVWRIGSGEPPRKLEIPDEGVYRRANDIAASADGRLLALTSADRTARVFDVPTGALVATLRDHGAETWGVSFAPDGAVLATGGADGCVRLYDTASWRQLAALRGHTRAVAALVHLPDGRLVSAGADGTLRLWDAPPESYGDERFRHGSLCYASQYDARGERVVTFGHDGDVRVWDATTWAPLGRFHAHDGTGVHASFSPDGARIVTTSWDTTAKLWDAATFEELRSFACGVGVAHADISPDGAFVACATTQGRTLVFSAADGSRAAELEVGTRGAAQVRFRGDGALLAVACGDGVLRTFATADWSARTAQRAGRAGLTACDWVGTGTRVVTTSSDGTIRRCDVDGTSEPVVLATTDATPQHARVSPDGRRVAVAADGVLFVDVVHGGVLLRTHVLADQPYDLAWAPDGTRVVVTDCPGAGIVLDARRLRDVQAAGRADPGGPK